MAALPLEPMYAKAIILSRSLECINEMIIVVSMLSVENIFFIPHDKKESAKLARAQFSAVEGDHLTLLNIYLAYKSTSLSLRKGWCRDNFINGRSMEKVDDIKNQLLDYCKEMKLLTEDEERRSREQLSTSFSFTSSEKSERFLKALASSFFMQAAVRQPNGSYYVRTLTDCKETFIHPSSGLFQRKPKCVIYNELVCTTRNYMRDVSVIDVSWLAEVAPEYYKLAPSFSPSSSSSSSSSQK